MTDQRDGGIAWTDETWNVIRGCSDVNDDCRNCYAKQLAATRLAHPPQPEIKDGIGTLRAAQPAGPYFGLAEMRNGRAYWTGQVQLVEDILLKPLAWARPRKVFVNAMSDLFHDGLTDDQIDRVVAVMAAAGHHTFQVLTKRPARMAAYLQRLSKSIKPLEAHARTFGRSFEWNGLSLLPWPIPNIWWGVSMGHQQAADDFLVPTIQCRDHAKVLWVSAEPLTGPLNLFHYMPREVETSQTRSAWVKGIDWLVVGGESGKDARPMHPAWPQALQAQAEQYGVSFHFKQWGEWVPVSYQGQGGLGLLNISCGMDGKRERVVQAGPDRTMDINMRRVGKKAAGRLLDGKPWDQWPITAVNAERIN